MRLLDVNVLVNAFRPDTAHHGVAHEELARLRASAEPLVILTEVAIGFVRVVTNPRVFARPDHPDAALAALDAWCSAPSMRVQEAGPGRWREYRRLMGAHQTRGNDVHDVLLAAAALDLSATLVTGDRGFRRFDGLHLQLL